MTLLMITDIRKSIYDSGSDIVTAVFMNGEVRGGDKIRSPNENTLLALESATAQKDIPAIGVHCGDQYIRMRANPDHGLAVGERLRLESI